MSLIKPLTPDQEFFERKRKELEELSRLKDSLLCERIALNADSFKSFGEYVRAVNALTDRINTISIRIKSTNDRIAPPKRKRLPVTTV